MPRRTPPAEPTLTSPIAVIGLSGQVASDLRGRLVRGELAPGQQLSETALAHTLEVSRNTLREGFRILTQEGLLTHVPHRGVFVATPSIAAIIDIYRVRRIIEGQAVIMTSRRHPASFRMRAAVEAQEAARDLGDWVTVGTENMRFHGAIVALSDSERLGVLYSSIAVELRLAFGLLDDPEFLHAPYVTQNREILELFESGNNAASAALLDDYLVTSERTVLAAYSRLTED